MSEKQKPYRAGKRFRMTAEQKERVATAVEAIAPAPDQSVTLHVDEQDELRLRIVKKGKLQTL